jgi:hypothetical protein
VRAVSNIPRMIVALALIAGLGFAGIRPCNEKGIKQASSCSTRHDSQTSKCISTTGKCCCGSECHCGSPLPTQENKSALPARSSDLVQLIAVVPEMVVFVDVIDASSSFYGSQTYHVGFATNLIAQGTRLNI